MRETEKSQGDIDRINYTQPRVAWWNAVACRRDASKGLSGYYHRRLEEVYRFLAVPGKRVLEIGCGQGDLLAALKPAAGVGVDFSGEMIKRAKERHPQLRFIQADAYQLNLEEKFDIIILSDLVDDLWDVQEVFRQIKSLSTPKTRLIINFYSRLWELPLFIAQKLGLATPLLPQNWLTAEDIAGLLDLADFEVIRHWQEILMPIPLGFLSAFFNRYLAKLWPFKLAGLTNFVIARPLPQPEALTQKPSLSVIIPARNEAGNIPEIFARRPELGRETELIFVEGHSKDDTYKVIEEAIAQHPECRCKLIRQDGRGKGDAVRAGFAQASGDILMILDADLTVPPEDLVHFYQALCSGKGEFINGVRLVYPMQKQAMPFLNFLANKFFTLAFSWLLGQHIKDTLCGTKALWRSDYELIASNRAYFGDFDPFGDFDLLFGAAKLNLKIVDLPIRYRERTYGTTNIRRWQHGRLLLKMVAFALRRLKFV